MHANDALINATFVIQADRIAHLRMGIFVPRLVAWDGEERGEIRFGTSTQAFRQYELDEECFPEKDERNPEARSTSISSILQVGFGRRIGYS